MRCSRECCDIDDDVRYGPCAFLPTRHVFSILTFSGLAVFSMLRVDMSIAILAMVNPDMTTSKSDMEVIDCPELLHPNPWNGTDSVERNVPEETGQFFDWDISTQSEILGSFGLGFASMQLVGVMLVRRFGGKWTFGIGLLSSSIVTLLTPMAAGRGSPELIAMRALQGLSQCAVVPSVNFLISQWVPIKERTFILSFIHNGIWIGYSVGLLLSGVLISSDILGGWPSVFYVFGASGCFLFILWTLLIHETPSVHPRISTSELRVIYEGMNNHEQLPSDAPLRAIFTSAPAWALIIAAFGYKWINYVISLELPTFFASILHFDILTNSMLCSALYALHALSALVAGYVSHTLVKKQSVASTSVRKLMNSIASFGSGTCLLFVIFGGCNPVYAVSLICIGMFVSGFTAHGFNCAPEEMSPRYSGALNGVINTLSCTTGFLSPIVVGQLTSEGYTSEGWNMVFVVSAATCYFCGAFFLAFGNTEVQPWDDVTERTSIIKASAPLYHEGGASHSSSTCNSLN